MPFFNRGNYLLGGVAAALCILFALFFGVKSFFFRPFVMTSVNSQTYTWKSEQWTLVNYFAQWCKPCLKEIPELNTLHTDKTIRVFGVSFDELSDNDIVEMVKRNDIQFPILDGQTSLNLPTQRPSVLPTSYLISPEGDIEHILRGEITQAQLKTLLSTSN